jgi:NAD(P)-dependent dehydrogenase (short-subunit alcohol dehydrogenase family)
LLLARKRGRAIVNTVSPGATDTDLLRSSNPPEALERTTALTTLGRLGAAADIADVVAFLASAGVQVRADVLDLWVKNI